VIVRTVALGIALSALALGGPATVTTLAGSGASGFRDGSRLQAEFMLPAALAMDRQGNLYVADAAAQRIRVVGVDGHVRTLAGSGQPILHGLWVEPGLRDGPGAQARFNVPCGIAVGPDGLVYVADTYNSRIRRIARDGTVSTFAVLRLPVGLAFDHAGNLYVADRELGVQRIAPDGTVTAFPLNVTRPFGVAVYERGADPPIVFAVDADGIVSSAGGAGGTRLREVSADGRAIGIPYQLVALGPSTFVYTDASTNTVHYVHGDTSVLLGGDDRRDQSDGGGFADGPSPGSRFNAPLGIIAAPDGSFLIADGGNRRIRRVAGFDRREVIDDSGLAEWFLIHFPNAAPAASPNPAAPPEMQSAVPFPPARDRSGDFRILYVGNSVVWWDTDWSRSIAGIAEGDINRALPVRARRVRLIPMRFIGTNVDGLADYLQEIADTGLVDAVVLHLNDGIAGTDPRDPWAPRTLAALQRADRALRAAHVPLLTVANPFPTELGPTEETWGKVLTDGLVPHYLDREEGWRTLLAASGTPSVDLWPLFFDELRSPAHRPIFSTHDAHFTAYGRELVGDAVAKALLRLHPWTVADRRVHVPGSRPTAVVRRE
jgi:DNA-binding beta-propeller fold protein YncE/lysophospholipase L1-like esterase